MVRLTDAEKRIWINRIRDLSVAEAEWVRSILDTFWPIEEPRAPISGAPHGGGER